MKNLSLKRGFSPVIFIFSIFIFGIIAIVAYINIGPDWQRPAPANTPSGTLSADWKTYANNKYGFEIKYHPELEPQELTGSETIDAPGQFSYLVEIGFGAVPLKSEFGYILTVRKPRSVSDIRLELVGHITDKIASEEKTLINGNSWTKLNYQLLLTTDYVPVTLAIMDNERYTYQITTSESYVDQVLSTFEFIDTLETGTETPCFSSSECWCRGFDGASFSDEKVPGLCNLETNTCGQCTYR